MLHPSEIRTLKRVKLSCLRLVAGAQTFELVYSLLVGFKVPADKITGLTATLICYLWRPYLLSISYRLVLTSCEYQSKQIALCTIQWQGTCYLPFLLVILYTTCFNTKITVHFHTDTHTHKIISQILRLINRYLDIWRSRSSAKSSTVSAGRLKCFEEELCSCLQGRIPELFLWNTGTLRPNETSVSVYCWAPRDKFFQ